ncbi:MAG: hypothetical protein WCY37_02680 [Candidatus Dojkabacteria bacterium]|jgi:hypothetical protein
MQKRDILKTKSLDDLRKQIKENNGIVRFLIHPFYSEDTTINKKKRFVTQEYLSKRDDFIKININKGLVIFQPKYLLNDLWTNLEVFDLESVYYLATRDYEATPFEGSEGWDELVRILKLLNVQAVELSGMYLDFRTQKEALDKFDPKYDELHQIPNFIKETDNYIEKFQIASEWLQKRYVPEGCVGFAAISLLERGVDVYFSDLTTPDTVSDII